MDEQKHFYDAETIAERYKCSKAKAYLIIRSIRAFCQSDRYGLPLTGKLLPQEVEFWENHFLDSVKVINGRSPADEGRRI